MSASIEKFFSASRPLVLVGMMGAGKTSVGQALAKILGVPFHDSDAEVEASAGQSVAQIFDSLGEAEFRKLEKQAVARLLEQGGNVLSLGGGAFVDAETRQKIKEMAFSVWLKVDPAILLERVMRHHHRPLLNDGNPKEKMERLLTDRAPFYALADLTFDCGNRSVAENARLIAEALQAAQAFRIP